MSNLKKYSLNPETLLYEPLKVSLKTRLVKTLLVFFISIGLAVLYFWIYTSVLGYDSPKTAILKRHNARLTSRIEVMNSRLDRYDEMLAAFELRDDDIYRSIFGMNEMTDEVRKAGFVGGDGRYSYLDGLGSNSKLKLTAMRLDRLTKELYVESKSFDQVAALSKQAGDMASAIPAIPPFCPDKRKYRISSPFGYRIDPVYGSGEFHQGQDFPMDVGTPLYATGDGVVEQVNFNFWGYGNELVIDHGFGYKTRYAHMNIINVAEGMKIKRGDCIGESGNSGKSTGAHLHYEVIYRGNRVNPMNYLDLEMTVEEYNTMVRKRSEDSQELLRPSFRVMRR